MNDSWKKLLKSELALRLFEPVGVVVRWSGYYFSGEASAVEAYARWQAKQT